MTDDEIVRLYKTSTGRDVEGYYNTIEELKKFAGIVVAAEREACAKVCEEVIRDCGWQNQIKDAAEFLAYEIRCRDENELEQGGEK